MENNCGNCAFWEQDPRSAINGECLFRLPPWVCERIDDLRPRGVDPPTGTYTYSKDWCSFWLRRNDD